MEINLIGHLGRELEGSPSGVPEESACFLVYAVGRLFPMDAGVSRNED